MQLLEKEGYVYHYENILNSKDYSGITQYRNRIYIAAFKDKELADTYLSLRDKYIVTKTQTKDFGWIVRSSEKPPMKYYYTQDEPGKCISIRFNEHFIPNITEKAVFYQYRRKYIRKNKNGLCPALTASMGQGGHNVPIILDDWGIRKLTPRECLRVQGFPAWFDFPKNMADCHKYKQIGNSVTIPVVKQFALLIHETLETVDMRNTAK